MSESFTPSAEQTDDGTERYQRIYEENKAELFAFVMDCKGDHDYIPKLHGYLGLDDGDASQFRHSIADTFNCYLVGGGIRNGKILNLYENVVDFRQKFTAMIVDIFGANYQELLPPRTVNMLWESTHTMLKNKYHVEGIRRAA